MNNQKGFALIQVMIAATIFSAVALAMSTLIAEQRNATTYLEDKLEKIGLVRNLETLLRDSTSCQLSLQTVKIPAIGAYEDIASLNDNLGAPVYSSNTQVSNLNLGQIRIKNDSVPGASSSGLVDIEVPVNRVRKSGGPKDFKSFTTKVSVNVDASGNIISCGPSSSNLSVSYGSFTGSQTVTPAAGFTAAQCNLLVSLENFGWYGQNKNGGAFITYGPGLSVACNSRDGSSNKVNERCRYQMICTK